MLKLPSRRALVWIGAAVSLLGMAWIIVGAAARTSGHFGSGASVAPEAMLFLGLVIEVVGIFRRAGAASRRLALRNFSWCIGCCYPFDERAADTSMLTCPECGVSFRAGEAREWNRDHPERVRKPDS